MIGRNGRKPQNSKLDETIEIKRNEKSVMEEFRYVFSLPVRYERN